MNDSMALDAQNLTAAFFGVVITLSAAGRKIVSSDAARLLLTWQAAVPAKERRIEE